MQSGVRPEVHPKELPNPSHPAGSSHFPILGTTIGILMGLIIGMSLIDTIGIVGVVGVVASWLVGIFVVAPRAARLFLRKLSNPSEEDALAISLAARHILVNTALSCGDSDFKIKLQDEKGNVLEAHPLDLIADKVIHRMSTRFDMAQKDVLARATRGAHPFNQDQNLELEMDIKQGIIDQFLGPMVDSTFEGRRADAVKARLFTWLMKPQGNGPGGFGSSQGPAPQLPAGGGW